MKRVVLNAVAVLGLMALALVIGVSPAKADTTIDFGTGLSSPGGTVTLYSDGSFSGSGVPIGVLNVTGAPSNNGTYAITSGALSFATGGLSGASAIQIVGCISGLAGLGSNCSQVLLSGTISSFSAQTLGGQIRGMSGTGPDNKNATLLTDLGIAPGTPFTFFGFSLTSNSLGTSNPAAGKTTSSTSNSTDILNTTVPEPGTLVLFGTGLLSLAGLVRRKLRA